LNINEILQHSAIPMFNNSIVSTTARQKNAFLFFLFYRKSETAVSLR
jgi:hypothetical protein